jgi:hypothetical protein
MEPGDRKMFAPLFSGEARSVEDQVCAVLGAHPAGVTASGLADELLRLGYAIGLKAPVRERIEGLLGELERAEWVERIPDGRYRVVAAARTGKIRRA